jgi:hypothetical protein
MENCLPRNGLINAQIMPMQTDRSDHKENSVYVVLPELFKGIAGKQPALTAAITERKFCT